MSRKDATGSHHLDSSFQPFLSKRIYVYSETAKVFLNSLIAACEVFISWKFFCCYEYDLINLSWFASNQAKILLQNEEYLEQEYHLGIHVLMHKESQLVFQP